MQTLTTVFS